MTPARKDHIRTVIARNLDAAARQVTGPTGESLANAADVIHELLAALEEAETAGQPTGPCQHERSSSRLGRPSVCSDCGEEL